MGEVAAMAIRKIFQSLAGRYLGQGLEKRALRSIVSNARRDLINSGKEVTPDAIKKASVRAIRMKSAKNAVGDASDTAFFAGSTAEGVKLYQAHKDKALENKVKGQYPKLFQQYANSSYTDIGKFLKSKGINIS